MIYVINGTKAQYIKTIPVMLELEKQGIEYRLVDTGQHFSITPSLRKVFNIREPDIFLCNKNKNVSKMIYAIAWNFRIIIKGCLRLRKVIGKNDFCIVLGDTLSTLQGAIIAKFCKSKLIHIESGERTHNLTKPFPEEIIRIIVDKMSDICCASSEYSYNNLIKEKIKGDIVNLNYNTVLDAVILSKNHPLKIDLPEEFVLVSIHRAETVYSKKRMSVIVDTVLKISENTPIIWGLHEVTKNRLDKYQLLDKLRNNKNIHLRQLFDYCDFMSVMQKSNFIITDGGGPQEESFLLNVPCLLMRTETERSYYKNICLSMFDPSIIKDFLPHYSDYKREEEFRFESPSKKLVSWLKENYPELKTKQPTVSFP